LYYYEIISDLGREAYHEQLVCAESFCGTLENICAAHWGVS